MFQNLQKISVTYRERIKQAFMVIHLLIGLVILFTTWTVYTMNAQSAISFTVALWFGRLSVVLYALTLIPGICRRLEIRHPIPAILMLFRRQIGIVMFLLVFVHFWVYSGINIWLKGIIPEQFPPFTIFGTIAFYLLLIMFLTSNALSVKYLKKWWYRIHGVTYVVLGCAFLHVYLQNISLWTLILGSTIFFEVLSFFSLFQRNQKKRKASAEADYSSEK